MGEAKRKKAKLSPVQVKALELTHKLVNDGKLVAGGFAAFMMHHKIEPEDPRTPHLYQAFFSGAEHLWSSIMGTLDPGVEETPADMKRMDAINKELDAWRTEQMALYAKQFKTEGSA